MAKSTHGGARKGAGRPKKEQSQTTALATTVTPEEAITSSNEDLLMEFQAGRDRLGNTYQFSLKQAEAMLAVGFGPTSFYEGRDVLKRAAEKVQALPNELKEQAKLPAPTKT